MASRYTDKTEISHAEYLQLLGLAMLARRHTSTLLEIVSRASELVGEKDESGHAADEMWSDDPCVDEMLRKLEITVLAPQPKVMPKATPKGNAE